MIKDKFYSASVALFILIIPFYYRHITFSDALFSKNLFFIFYILLSVFLFGVKGSKNNNIAIYLLPILLLSFWNWYSDISFAVIFQWLFISCGVIYCRQLVGFRLNSNYIKYSMSAVCIISCLWVILNKLGINPYHWWVNGQSLQMGSNKKWIETSEAIRVMGPLANHTMSSVLIGITAQASPLLLVLSLPAMYFCDSSMGWFALITGAVYGFIGIRRALIMGGIGCILVGAYYYFIHSGGIEFLNPQERFRIWIGAIEIQSNPIIGMGPGYFYDKFRTFYQMAEVHTKPHNEFLSMYFFFGVIGIWCFYGLVSQIKWRNTFHHRALVAFICSCVGGYNFHVSSIALVGIVCYALSVTRE